MVARYLLSLIFNGIFVHYVHGKLTKQTICPEKKYRKRLEILILSRTKDGSGLHGGARSQIDTLFTVNFKYFPEEIRNKLSCNLHPWLVTFIYIIIFMTFSWIFLFPLYLNRPWIILNACKIKIPFFSKEIKKFTNKSWPKIYVAASVLRGCKINPEKILDRSPIDESDDE